MNRREFLKGLGLSTLTALVPQFALAKSIGFSGNRRLLVMVELKGANDGLNTLVPYTNPAYYDARPSLALDKTTLATLNGSFGMHPKLTPLLSAWRAGEMGWIHGLGYENPNRSHFESIEIWDSASGDTSRLHDGWVAQCFPEYELGGVAVDTNLGPLYGERFSALSITDPYRFVDQGKDIKAAYSGDVSNGALRHILQVQSEVDLLADSLADYLDDVPKEKLEFAGNSFERSLKSVYALIASGINVPAYKISLGNFDTHVAQARKHEILLDKLANGLIKFRTNLQHIGMWDEVVVMTYSEFGRRVNENGSKGTDHGTAAPHMVLGGKIRGGFYGEHPSLTDLDERGDQYHTTDFRDMYATIRDDWWQLNKTGLGRSLGFV